MRREIAESLEKNRHEMEERLQLTKNFDLVERKLKVGDRDACLSTDIPLENDRDYVMSLLAVLSGGSRRAAYQVEELGGSVCENGYSIPKVQFSRKENEK